jgi:hypothetical protein
MLTYEQFRDAIRGVLAPLGEAGTTWTEIRTAAKLPQALPNNQWVHRLDADIGLERRKDTHGIIRWRLRLSVAVMVKQNRLSLPSAPVPDQIAGRLAWNQSRSIERAHFFTLGYTGRKMDELLEAMKAAGVRTLLDIRQNPVSMYRPELSKSNLRCTVESNGIAYVHAPDLGVPRDIRAKAIESGTRETIWRWYDEHVVGPRFGRSLHWFLNGFDFPAALMCVEIDPHECHRHRVSEALERRGLRGFDL